MKERNIGIDILKFLAVLLITNSHMELLYGKYSVLATGGTIGDALFLFCSGFTLFMKPMTSIREFPDWYKRRINRIYPTVLAIAVIKCTFFGGHSTINDIILHGGGWFVSCIMIYYVFIFLIGLYARKHINLIIVLVSLASCVWFFTLERPFPFNMYGLEGGYLKWLLYFNFMLLGAKVGSMTQQADGSSAARHLICALLGIVGFYAFYMAGVKVEMVESLEVLNFIPLLFGVYYLYRWANGQSARRLYTNKTGHFVVRFIGGLCLEVYLIQDCLFTDRLNALFPLNLLIVFLAIVLAAYLARCLARLISQTFREAPYEWRAIIDKY